MVMFSLETAPKRPEPESPGPVGCYDAANKAGAGEGPGPQMAMGRIEHTLLDEGRASSPTDLRPSPATPPYHKK